jgi:hypothetical protein
MLAEFDPYRWDLLIFVVGVVAMVLIHRWRVRKMKEEDLAALDRFSTGFTNLTLTYWHDESLKPLQKEIDLANKLFSAVQATWGTRFASCTHESFDIWFVRSPEQRVGWRQYGGIKWVDIPKVAGIAPTNADNGYGGLRSGRTVYVATFIEGRDPLKLLAHEFTHAVTGISNDAKGVHPPEFDIEKKKLIAELEKME